MQKMSTSFRFVNQGFIHCALHLMQTTSVLLQIVANLIPNLIQIQKVPDGKSF
jgi:hypothetical protein